MCTAQHAGLPATVVKRSEVILEIEKHVTCGGYMRWKYSAAVDRWDVYTYCVACRSCAGRNADRERKRGDIGAPARKRSFVGAAAKSMYFAGRQFVRVGVRLAVGVRASACMSACPCACHIAPCHTHVSSFNHHTQLHGRSSCL